MRSPQAAVLPPKKFLIDWPASIDVRLAGRSAAVGGARRFLLPTLAATLGATLAVFGVGLRAVPPLLLGPCPPASGWPRKAPWLCAAPAALPPAVSPVSHTADAAALTRGEERRSRVPRPAATWRPEDTPRPPLLGTPRAKTGMPSSAKRREE